MQHLFNSQGHHIANVVGDQLYTSSWKNIGHFRSGENFFIDMKWYYLWEITSKNRLMYKKHNWYTGMCFGSYGNFGNIGNFWNPWNDGIASVGWDFKDIDEIKLNWE